MKVVVEIQACNGDYCYNATFYGDNADTNAIAFVERKNEETCPANSYGTIVWHLIEGETPALMDFFYPSCEHGMSLQLCMGPDHFMSYAQERALFG